MVDFCWESGVNSQGSLGVTGGSGKVFRHGGGLVLYNLRCFKVNAPTGGNLAPMALSFLVELDASDIYPYLYLWSQHTNRICRIAARMKCRHLAYLEQTLHEKCIHSHFASSHPKTNRKCAFGETAHEVFP